ncbi:hypothetical protein EVAR_64662_1 [Eumeta japonica]|uniref:Uncharacterized protein n=1 Tax=Eumeta variegata TaxID=151549 RepID=A0A4C2A7X6_EUMVA|nr:hypothetical protein EVAR_64662_1 [Eumeta japonica]
MEDIVPTYQGAPGSSAEVVLQNLELVECLRVGVGEDWRRVRHHRPYALCLEPSRQLVDGLLEARSNYWKLLPLRYRAVSSAKRELDACLRARNVVRVRGVKQRGECGALRDSGCDQSLAEMLFMPEGEMSVRQVLLDDEDRDDLGLVAGGVCILSRRAKLYRMPLRHRKLLQFSFAFKTLRDVFDKSEGLLGRSGLA